MTARPRIGELLINAGLLTREQLTQALEQQRAQGAGGRRLGQLLVDLGFVAEAQLTKVLSQQLSVPWVSLQHIDFSRQLLDLVPREIAEEYCLIPVYVRHERKVGDTLYLAMEDPTHDDAVRSVMAAAGMPVKSMIAAPSDIRAAIGAFYGADRPSIVQLEGVDEPLTALPLKARSARPGASVASVRPGSAAVRASVVPGGGAVSPREAPTVPERRPGVSDAPRAHAATVPEGRLSAPPEELGPASGAAASAVVSDRPRYSIEPTVIIEDDEFDDALGAPTIPEGVEPPAVAPAAASADSVASTASTHPVAAQSVARTGSRPPAAATAAQSVARSDAPGAAPPRDDLRASTAATSARASDGAAPAKRPAGGRTISLTLLDGTTIKIPAQQQQQQRRGQGAAIPADEPAATPASHAQQLTTRDLVAALSAVAHGADPGETLGGYRWEAITAALLSLLLRKQVITDWEFLEELKKT